MNKINRARREILFSLFFLVLLFGCEKEKDLYRPYLGTWYARGCVANGGPINCGLPYPIPREMDITINLNEDKTFMSTSFGDTVKGSYIIEKVKDPNRDNQEVDRLIKMVAGTSSEHNIAIEQDGALSVYQNCCTKYFYVK